ncbi:MAG: hypothetical protein Q9165_007270 [Trypethelium subeluteriae]
MATPSLLSACLPEEYKNLETIALAGEAVPQALVTTWADRVHLMNLYGPSECGPVSTVTTLTPGKPVTIGRPLSGLSAYVLDHHKHPVPRGIAGEIYISGEQMTRGYWNANAKAQTEALFVLNPFSSRPEQRYMYRSGDLGFWDSDMNLHYLGRADNQVKIRGFRVELEEIERTILAVSEAKVGSAAAVTVSVTANTVRIAAFVTPENVDTTLLHESAAARLPSYSRPAHIFAVSALPKSANFKIDRKTLTARAASLFTAEKDEVAAKGLAEQLTPTEEILVTIWKELLGFHSDASIRRDDNFLDLGGNSLLAIRAARQISTAISRQIPIALLIRETTLKQLANAIDKHTAVPVTRAAESSFSTNWLSIRQGLQVDDSSRAYVLSHLERDMYRAISASSSREAFNTAVQLSLHGNVDITALADGFAAVVRRNPILRARYVVSEDQPARTISPETSVPEIFGEEPSEGVITSLACRSFDLAHEQLIKVAIFSGGQGGTGRRTEVVMVTHHLITDKASISLMLKLVGNEYQRLKGSTELPADRRNGIGMPTEASLAEGPSYIDWARWLDLHQKSPTSHGPSQETDHLEFWTQHLANIQPMPWEHRSKLRQSNNTLGRSSFSIPYPNSTTATRQGQRYSQRLAVAAVALALRTVYGTSDVVLGLPYMNRDEPATADMLGLFVDRMPIRILLDQDSLASADALVEAVTAEINLAVEHHTPYEQIRSVARPGRDDEVVDIMVLYHWQSDALEKALDLGPEVRVSEKHGVKPSGTLFPLLVEFNEQVDGSLHVEIEYRMEAVSAESITTLETRLPTVIQALTQRALP